MSAGMIYGAWDFSQDRLIEGEDLKNEIQLDKQQTDVEIQTNTIQHTDEILEFEATNEGNTEHDINSLSIIADGSILDESINEVMVIEYPDSGVWLPGDTVYFNVTIGEEPDNLVLVVDNGLQEFCREW
ncbi:hypothetical protein [Methanonatronarchaeum thermophilum]|nr:hypothetical protein [Methanonatronarchaeum thermophilum]